MRGKRAKRERREGLPADLKAELREKVRTLAIARKAKTDAASGVYKQTEQEARQRRNRAVAEAEAAFRSERAALVDEAYEQARRRAMVPRGASTA